MEGFLRYRFRGLIFGGAYTWRGLFLEFYGIVICQWRTDQNYFLPKPKAEANN